MSVMNRLLFCLMGASAVLGVGANYAPEVAPKLPEDFCPSTSGTITETTGECMCNWQSEQGCVGSKCSFQGGLAWYHYTCEDCRCVREPNLRGTLSSS